ncbi:olfactory receptor 1M1-like [Dermochelys coriacea]|uniref:olfactory receptor 1M1-like n=1 Tax=Dermochelys coriacea TaxID=27794 RepID=UPI001CA8A4EC|nr:olfactory receptor 1M1-like [Dermochelys coriacea]
MAFLCKHRIQVFPYLDDRLIKGHSRSQMDDQALFFSSVKVHLAIISAFHLSADGFSDFANPMLMEKGEGENQTAVTEFILLGFGDLPELPTLLFLVFLVIYIVTVAGNLLIIALVMIDQHLHTPMYFFLGNLSFLETCYTSTILPRLLDSLLTAMLKLSCSDTSLITLVLYIFSFLDAVFPFLLTLTSYVCIISTILKIPSTTGRQKAFSTCSSHLIIVALFYGTIMIVYMLPKSNTLRALNKVLSVIYTVLTPLTNLLIYSLRNREVKDALRNAVRKCSAPAVLQGLPFILPAMLRYFRKREAKKLVTCLLAEDGAPLMDLEEMRGRARDFYASLFSLDLTNAEACLVLCTKLPTVSAGD